jgi:hypothetical protein
VRDILFDALKESMGLAKDAPKEAQVKTDQVFHKPLRPDLRVRAAAQTSHMDIINIQLTDPKWTLGYETKVDPAEAEHKELRPVRGDDPSRIRKSIAAIKAARKSSNKVAMAPQSPVPDENGKVYREVPPGEVKDVSAFSREELYLLRQMRREVLGADPAAVLWKRGDRPDGAPPNHLTFPEFIQAVNIVAPTALERSAKLSTYASRREYIEAVRYNKTLMRRIYVKFLTMQTAVESEGLEELLNWPLFVTFVQTGGAAAISNLSGK